MTTAENPVPVDGPERQWMSRPLLKTTPEMYEADTDLIERTNSGETVSEQEAFGRYFARMEEEDAEYFAHIKTMAQQRSERFPEAVREASERSLQIVVPAYREGQNMDTFLASLKQQFEDEQNSSWGVTFVFDFKLPYRKGQEFGTMKEMVQAISDFAETNPEYADRVDFVFFSRAPQADQHPVLPVGLARKVGEDVLKWQKLQALKAGNKKAQETPLYLGLMDADTTQLTDGVLSEMADATRRTSDDTPRVIRVQGSYDTDDVRDNLFLHPLQFNWEGATSQVAHNTKYMPFTVGRLSAVPARELAMTGGGFARKLPFTDEDVRHGGQIKWHLDNVEMVELQGKYATSARREIGMMKGLKQLAAERMDDDTHEVTMDMKTLRCAALIEMYGNWTAQHGSEFENEATDADWEQILSDPDMFREAVSPEVIEIMTNASYRFTFWAIYSVDTLSEAGVPEVVELKNQFLRGDISHFEVQLNTLNFLRDLRAHDEERLEKMRPLLAQVDRAARASTRKLLEDNHIAYEEEDTICFGILEGSRDFPGEDVWNQGETPTSDEVNSIPIAKPFKIAKDQTEYMEHIRKQLQKRSN